MSRGKDATRVGAWARTALVLTLVLLAAAPQAFGRDSRAKAPVPVVFVHGNSGSAQQFETNAMRLTSNGFPQRRIFAYEYDTLTSSNEAAVANLDGYIDDVKARTGSDVVDVLAHSRGTTVMHTYLGDPYRAAEVRRYVNFDGRTSEAEPGGVPTLAVWGEGDPARQIGGAENAYYPDKGHTEVTTSREAFERFYEFLLGEEPRTRSVAPEQPKNVTVKGRVLEFPNNAGMDGATLRVFRLNPATGQRSRSQPVYERVLGESGDFGRIHVNGRRHYEFEVSRPGESTIHNYPEPFERDDHFYRVLSAPLLDQFIERSTDHVAIAVTRMREFRGDQDPAAANDRLEFNGFNVITPATAPRARRVIAVFTFDKGSDGVSDTGQAQPPFGSIPFLTGVDNFVPASSDASGTVAVREVVRGPRPHSETLNVPDWASDLHTVSVYFKDYEAKAFRKRR